MTRLLGTFGLGGIFFLISPGLRSAVADGCGALGQQLDRHTPYSYIVLGVVVLLSGMLFVYKSAQPRS